MKSLSLEEGVWVNKVLFDGKCNENSDSAKEPVKVYVEGEVDLNEEITQCMNWDNDMLVTVKRYEVREVTLPVWLSVEEWIRDRIDWSYFWAIPKAVTLPECYQRTLKGMQNSMYRDALVALLAAKKLRSPLKISFQAQVIAWLETSPEDRKYAFPLSDKQCDLLIWNKLAASLENKNRSASLYYSARYREPVGVSV